MADDDSMFKRVGYPIVCVVAFGVAGYLTITSLNKDPIQEMPDDQENASPYFCNACSKDVMLTPRAAAEQNKKGQVVTRGGEGTEGPRSSHRRLKIVCPNCNATELVPATKCPDCNTVYVGGDCPKCVVNAESEEAAAPEEETPTGRDR